MQERKQVESPVEGEKPVCDKSAYDLAKQQAVELFDRGFHLVGVIEATRDDWHDR